MRGNHYVFLWASTSVAFLSLTAELEFYFHSENRMQAEAALDHSTAQRLSASGREPLALPNNDSQSPLDLSSVWDQADRDALNLSPEAPAAPKRASSAGRHSAHGRSAGLWDRLPTSHGSWERPVDDEDLDAATWEDGTGRRKYFPTRHDSTVSRSAAAPISRLPEKHPSSAPAAADHREKRTAEPSKRTAVALHPAGKPVGGNAKRPASWIEALGGRPQYLRNDRVREMLKMPNWDGHGSERSRGHSRPSREPNPVRGREKKPGRGRLASRRSPKAPSLAKLLGGGMLRPPAEPPKIPEPAQLQALQIPNPPEGQADLVAMAGPEMVRVRPPAAEANYPGWRHADIGQKDARWHSAGGDEYWHKKEAWGLDRNGRWCWLLETGGHWWAWNEGQPLLLWHDDHWWWNASGRWLLYHEGEPWSYRRFDQWSLDGLEHPESGTKIVYSADGQRAAVVRPGESVAVVDVRSGTVIGRWANPPRFASGDR